MGGGEASGLTGAAGAVGPEMPIGKMFFMRVQSEMSELMLAELRRAAGTMSFMNKTGKLQIHRTSRVNSDPD